MAIPPDLISIYHPTSINYSFVYSLYLGFVFPYISLYHLFIISTGKVLMSQAYSIDLIYSLIGYPNETEWLEFKSNNNDADRIAKDISALANSAAFHGRDCAYKIWGISDDDHKLIGTTFDPFRQKAKGNQDLLIWLKTHLSHNANYDFSEIYFENKKYIVLTIYAATNQPVRYNSIAYIRSGSSTTTLSGGSATESELWRKLQRNDFELQGAIKNDASSKISSFLYIDAYYELNRLTQPSSLEGILTDFIEQEIIKKQDDGTYTITNLGALLLAKDLSAFPNLRKRPLRILRFEGNGNFNILDDKTFNEGYAISLQRAEDYIKAVIPSKEVIDGAFRRIVYAYPQRAIRELLSNIVIHQDLTVTTSGPLVNIFDNRIEFCNPGVSLIPLERVLNAQPKTRNNALVNQLRLMDPCEEGGTGWDLAVAACEEYHMVAPKIESSEELGTKVTLYHGGAYPHMTKHERMDAAYWHACLKYASGESMNNQSLRERFGLDNEQKNTLAISRLIKECCKEGLIKAEDENAGTKYKRYIPSWA